MNEPFRKVLKDWVEILAIVGAAAWAITTFYLVEFFKPENSRSFFQVVVALEPAGDAATVGGAKLIPVRLRISGENASKKRIEVASGYLEVHGDKPSAAKPGQFSPENIEAQLNADKAVLSRYTGKGTTERLFVATVFEGWTFEVGEKQQFTRIIWVPEGRFNQLEANAYVLSGPKASSLKVTHGVDPKGNIDYLVASAKGDDQKVYKGTSKEGQALLSKLGLADSTDFLVMKASPPVAAASSSK